MPVWNPNSRTSAEYRGMRDDRKREHREIGRGVGAQTSGRRHEQRGKKEMPIKGEKRKASRDKKKKKKKRGKWKEKSE